MSNRQANEDNVIVAAQWLYNFTRKPWASMWLKYCIPSTCLNNFNRAVEALQEDTE